MKKEETEVDDDDHNDNYDVFADDTADIDDHQILVFLFLQNVAVMLSLKDHFEVQRTWSKLKYETFIHVNPPGSSRSLPEMEPDSCKWDRISWMWKYKKKNFFFSRAAFLRICILI